MSGETGERLYTLEWLEREAQDAIVSKDVGRFLEAMLNLEVHLDTEGQLRKPGYDMIYEELIIGSIKSKMFDDTSDFSRQLAKARQLKFEKLRKDLNNKLKEKDIDPIMEALFALEDMLTVALLPEYLRVQGSKLHDKAIQELKLIIEKETPEKRPRLSKDEKREAEIKRMVEKGVPEEEARVFVDKRTLKRAGLSICPICETVINVKREEHMVEGGVPYHKICWEKQKEREKEISAKIPLVVKGINVHCEYCKEPIYKGTLIMWDAPLGIMEDYRDSLLTLWFHHSKEQPCYEKWSEERGKKK